MPQKVQLNIVGLTTGHSQRNSYTLILGEVDGNLKLPVVIGSYEAQSIALVIEGLKPQRPLTHDLMQDFFDIYDIELKEVLINDLLEGVFFAKLITEKNGEVVEIDSRTSDAIALALRAGCPIYTYKKVMDDAGIVYDQEDESTDVPEKPSQKEEVEIKSSGNPLQQMSIENLKKELEKAIQIEDYDRAAVIRDEINARS
jgi:bifunctional DNase/RNase